VRPPRSLSRRGVVGVSACIFDVRAGIKKPNNLARITANSVILQVLQWKPTERLQNKLSAATVKSELEDAHRYGKTAN